MTEEEVIEKGLTKEEILALPWRTRVVIYQDSLDIEDKPGETWEDVVFYDNPWENETHTGEVYFEFSNYRRLRRISISVKEKETGRVLTRPPMIYGYRTKYITRPHHKTKEEREEFHYYRIAIGNGSERYINREILTKNVYPGLSYLEEKNFPKTRKVKVKVKNKKTNKMVTKTKIEEIKRYKIYDTFNSDSLVFETIEEVCEIIGTNPTDVNRLIDGEISQISGYKVYLY